MSYIKIDPTELSKASTKLGVNAARVSAAGNFIKLSGLLARTYVKNSFGPQVRAICNEGLAKSSKLSSSILGLGATLKIIALDFSAVDNRFLRGIVNKIKSLFTEKSSGSQPPVKADSGEISGKAAQDIRPTTKTVGYVKTVAKPPDCVAYVKTNRKVPSNAFNSEAFYSGKFRGKTGTRKDGAEYGQVPSAGAVMVESPLGSSKSGVDYGHASYVTEVKYDNAGKPVSFTIAEANWGKTAAERSTVHTETFTWNESKGAYYNANGHRSPDCFIY